MITWMRVNKMHFEILVEDQSGKRALDIIVPKIISPDQTYKVIAYKGIGRIPKGLRANGDASKRILLAQLPKLLQGYGKTFSGYGDGFSAAVVVVCDLDDKDLTNFRAELDAVLNRCNPPPDTRFCIAIEEGESWFLGDKKAIKAAYPNAKTHVLDQYVADSICGTWECLADAVFKGGAAALNKKGWMGIGAEKSVWAENISRHMDVGKNTSPSFRYFVKRIQGVRKLELRITVTPK